VPQLRPTISSTSFDREMRQCRELHDMASPRNLRFRSHVEDFAKAHWFSAPEKLWLYDRLGVNLVILTVGRPLPGQPYNIHFQSPVGHLQRHKERCSTEPFIVLLNPLPLKSTGAPVALSRFIYISSISLPWIV